MARLSALPWGTDTGARKGILEDEDLGPTSPTNMIRTMAHSPAALHGYLAFRDALDDGVLTPQLREQIALAVAETNLSLYCASAHTVAGLLAGLTGSEIEHARKADSVDPKVAAALQFVRTVLEYRGDITDMEFKSVHQAGFTDEEIVEIIANVALNLFTNYFTEVALVEVDFPAAQFHDNDVA